MIVKTFTALEKKKAIKKMLDYWYKYFKDDCALIKFFSKCTWKKQDDEYFIIYRGPEPKDK